jgi:hypothetical protein
MDFPLIEAIRTYFPKAEWSMKDGEYDKLIWISTDIPKPSKEELLQKVEQLEAERPLKDLRAERDRRLATTDWVTLKAYSTTTPVPEAWATYMQALRDLPTTTEDPANPVWPTQPSP